MFAQVKATGEIVEVTPITIESTAGTQQLFEEASRTSLCRRYSAEELDFDFKKSEIPVNFDCFNGKRHGTSKIDWDVYQAEVAKEIFPLFLKEMGADNEPETIVPQALHAVDVFVTELKKKYND